MSIDILDYNAGDETQLQDPTDPHESVERQFMNKLGKLITYAEEALQAGVGDVDSDEFYERRGGFLDMLADPQLQEWLQHMRVHNRVPFRRFAVKDEPEVEDAESL